MTVAVPMPPGLIALVRLSAALARGVDEDLTPFLQAALEQGAPEEVEEALLQAYLFLGYPAALRGFQAWRTASGRPPPAPAPEDRGAWHEAGRETCGAVYGSAYPALRRNISRLNRDLDRWMVVEGYGKVLARPGLPLWKRECCIAAILIVLGAEPQLRSHLRGALRTGAPAPVLAEVVDEAVAMTPAARRDRALKAWKDVLRRWEEA
ncbi:MAG: carboxymuconolactone decarboxylase family protein [Longimicrobiales bacterium]|nr:carboxymuconolactone decarboxylase family protein [Longimicrobiales bacterium]